MTGEKHVLVTGASGVLGWRLVRFFTGQGWNVDGTYLQNRPDLPGVRFRFLDLADCNSVQELARSADYDLVVHTAAMTSPDTCAKNPLACRRTNVEATQILAENLPPQVRLVFISTDLVFDGEGSLYKEEDRLNPVNLYGESKLEAEQIVVERPRSWVLRMAKIYAAGSPFHSCFVTWMKQRFESGEKVPLFHDQYRSPLYVGDMGPIVEALFQDEPDRQLFHAGGPKRMNRLELGRQFAEAMGYPKERIEATTAVSLGLAPRGQDCSLDSSRLFRLLGKETTAVLEGMQQLREDFG